MLVATGVYQAWRGVGSWSALTSTRYGQLLLIKVGLVLLMLGTAWFSRRWTGRLREAPAAATGDAASRAEPEADLDLALEPERRAQLARQQAVLTAAKVRRAQDGSRCRPGCGARC